MPPNRLCSLCYVYVFIAGTMTKMLCLPHIRESRFYFDRHIMSLRFLFIPLWLHSSLQKVYQWKQILAEKKKNEEQKWLSKLKALWTPLWFMALSEGSPENTVKNVALNLLAWLSSFRQDIKLKGPTSSITCHH